jgi:hypothetical protein
MVDSRAGRALRLGSTKSRLGSCSRRWRSERQLSNVENGRRASLEPEARGKNKKKRKMTEETHAIKSAHSWGMLGEGGDKRKQGRRAVETKSSQSSVSRKSAAVDDAGQPDWGYGATSSGRCIAIHPSITLARCMSRESSGLDPSECVTIKA